jgi:hypothetical protein
MDNIENGQNQNIGFVEKPEKISVIKILILIILVVIVIFAGLLLSKFLNKTNQVPKPVLSDTLPAGYQFKVMAQNKYPVGFPENLIVKGGVWQRGEDTTAGDGKNLKIVELIYKNTEPAVLASSFEKTFKDDAWLITGAANNNLPIIRTFNKTEKGVNEMVTLTIIKVNNVDSLANITITTN